MKVGILTFHFAHNYGAMLQAYGLSKYINSLGFDCSIVDYRLRYIYQWSEKYNPISYYHAQREDGFGMIRSLCRTLRYYPRLKQVKDERWKLFEAFMHSYLPMGHRIYKHNFSAAGYDALIVGSDQIWNSELTDGLQDIYFLNVDFGGRRIAYAASSGQASVVGDNEYLSHVLKKFDYLSCRESGLSTFCQKLLNRNITTVCDPIFLLEKDVWASLCTESIIKEKYILIYGFDENDLFFETVKEVSEKMNLPIVRIGNKPLPQLNVQTHYVKAGPAEFLTLFNNSTFVITNTFHGVSTAMVFNKPFITVLPEKRANRIVNVLSIANLNDRIIDDLEEINSVVDSEIDYKAVKSNMNELIETSRKFIKDSLSNG